MASTPEAPTWVQVRERAYELWERNHRPDGFEIEFWLLAERELRAERRRPSEDPHDEAPSRSPHRSDVAPQEGR